MDRIKRLIAMLGALVVACVASLFVVVPSASASEYDCVDASKAVLSHTWDGTTGTVKVTLGGEKPLCKKFYIGVALYSFDNPDAGMWPQTLSGVNRGSLQNPGDSVTVSAPAGCGQRDAYAGYGEEPQPSKTLTAPGKPYEPKFVSNLSKGPNTYAQDAPASCIKQPVVSPKAQLTSICEAGGASIVGQLDNSMSEATPQHNATVLYRLKASDGQQIEKSVEAGKVEEVILPFEGNVSVTVTAFFEGEVQLELTDTFSSEKCGPEVLPPTATAAISKAVCTDGDGPLAYATIVNTTSVANLPSKTVQEDTNVTVVVTSSIGFKKTVTVALGKSITVPVPLKVGQKVTITVKYNGEELAQKTITANCTVPQTPTKTPPSTLPQTGAVSSQELAIAAGLLAVGTLLMLISRRRTEAPAAP